MTYPFGGTADSPTGPSRAPYPIVPHDVEALPVIPKAIHCAGVGGNVVLRGVAGDVDVTMLIVEGGYIDVAARYVRATGTTATGLVALA